MERDRAEEIRKAAIKATPRGNATPRATPRSTGLGAGARMVATPRRRPGGI